MQLKRGLGGLAVLTAAAVTVTAATAAPREPSGAGPKILLRSTIALDAKAATVTLPLSQGRTPGGQKVWYIVSDSSDRADATWRKVNYAPKLKNALGTKAVEKVSSSGGQLVFPGTVDFSPKGSVVPSADGFPPKSVSPPAVGDKAYSPLIAIGGVVLDAPQLKNDSGQSDSIVSIDTRKHQVTLSLLKGFFGGKSVLYLHTDASVDVVSALEGSTYAPNLNTAPAVGSDGTRSARSAIIPVVNGARGKTNPDRQGLQSAVLGEGFPLNITQSLPGDPNYSPVWDVVPIVWSDSAVANGKRRLLRSAADVVSEVKAGNLTSGGTGPADASLGGLKAAGFISNCSIVSIG